MLYAPRSTGIAENYRLPAAVPSLEEVESYPGWTMTDDAMLQMYADQLRMREAMSGTYNGLIVMVGPCVVENNSIDGPDGPVYDSVAFQNELRKELREQTGNDPEVLKTIKEAIAAFIERGGLRKPRSKNGSAGLLANDPLQAKNIATLMANNGPDDADIKMSIATELADPQDFELQSLFSVLWSGARHNKVTTLRHIASAPIMDQQSLDVLRLISDPSIDISQAYAASKANPVLHSIVRTIESQGLSDYESREAICEAIINYNRKPFLFKTGEDGNLRVALDSRAVAAQSQVNTFTGKDGRQHGPITTLGNPYTGILFRGGIELTPAAYRKDLREVQATLDEDERQTGSHTAWGADMSHRAALQCTYGKRIEVGQEIAHQIMCEEIIAGNIRPQFIMIESTIYAGQAPEPEWGRSTIDPTVSARTAARMIIELASAVLAA